MKVTFAALKQAWNNASADEIEAAKQRAIRDGKLHVDSEGAVLEPRYLIFLVIGIYLLAALLPSAITTLNGANTTGWDATQTAIWGVFSVIILAVVIAKISE